MAIRAGVTMFLAALTCCSTQAQSMLLKKGQSGPMIDVAYVSTSADEYSDGTSGGEMHAGYACRILDFGLSTGYSSESKRPWQSDVQTNYTAGQFFDLYPIRLGSERTEFMIGLHEAYVGGFYDDVDPTLSGGGTLSLVARSVSNAGLALSIGYRGVKPSQRWGTKRNFATADAHVFWSQRGLGPVGLFFEYGYADGPDFATLGLTLSVVK